MTEPKRIAPRTLKGFRDYLPEAMIPRERLIDTARRVYRSYGFSPIDTPGPGISRNPRRQGERRDRQAALQVSGPRRPLGRAAVRSDGAAGPIRRRTRQRVGHPVQAIPHRHGLAGRKHAARPLPRVHAVRFRHHRHPLRRRRHRNRPGHPRSVSGDRLRRLHDPREQPHGADRAVGAARAGRSRDGRAPRVGQARQDRRRTPWPRRWSRPPAQRPEQARQVLRLSEITGGNDEVLRQVESLVAGSETGQAGVGQAARSARRRGGGGRAAGAAAARPVDRPRTGLLHGHGFRDVFGRPAGHRQRLLRRPLRQSGRAVHVAGVAGHRGLARAWTGCWRRWKSWA